MSSALLLNLPCLSPFPKYLAPFRGTHSSLWFFPATISTSGSSYGWPLPPISPQLLCFRIEGAGATQQELSHSSVLFIHHLDYVNYMMELHLERIQIQNKIEWGLIVEYGSRERAKDNSARYN